MSIEFKIIRYEYEPLCLIADCTPPHTLDIYFDAYGDVEDTTMADAGDTKSSCGMIA